MDDRTFVDILRDRAQVSSDKIAYRFLVDGDKKELTLTYGQLHQRALAIAARLKDEAKPGDRALLLYPPGLEFICAFFGCLYAGVIAVPAYPPNPHNLQSSIEKLELLTMDSTPSVMLSTGSIISLLKISSIKDGVMHAFTRSDNKHQEKITFSKVKKINTTKITASNINTAGLIRVNANDLAYLQYTSGSTGDPKGVIISHDNIVKNTACISYLTCKNVDFIVSWLPLYHDMGLVNSLFMPLYNDIDSVFFSPLDFISSPIKWLKAISSSRRCYSGGPNFAYELLLRKTTEEQTRHLSLSNWAVAFSGAETIRFDTLKRFINRFSKLGFKEQSICTCYGLAEITVDMTGRNVSNVEGELNVVKANADFLKNQSHLYDVSCDYFVSTGKVINDHQLIIVDPDSKDIMNEGGVGEIWCRGSSVAKGYWGRKEATQETFNAYTRCNDGPYMRTGDLGFLKDEQLYVVGRLKDMIIIRGRNYAPQDIEYHVETADLNVRKGCVAAFSYERNQQESVCIVCEVKKTTPKESYAGIIRSILAKVNTETQLSVSSVVLIKVGGMCKTTSGKVQRRKVKQKFLANSLPVIQCWESESRQLNENVKFEKTDDQGALCENLRLWLTQYCGKNKEDVTEDTSFDELSLDSIMIAEAASQLSDALDKKVDISDFLSYPTCAKLSRFLLNEKAVPCEKKRCDTMSFKHFFEHDSVSNHKSVTCEKVKGSEAYVHRFTVDPSNHGVLKAFRLLKRVTSFASRFTFRLYGSRYFSRTMAKQFDRAFSLRKGAQREKNDTGLLYRMAMRSKRILLTSQWYSLFSFLSYTTCARFLNKLKPTWGNAFCQYLKSRPSTLFMCFHSRTNIMILLPLLVRYLSREKKRLTIITDSFFNYRVLGLTLRAFNRLFKSGYLEVKYAADMMVLKELSENIQQGGYGLILIDRVNIQQQNCSVSTMIKQHQIDYDCPVIQSFQQRGFPIYTNLVNTLLNLGVDVTPVEAIVNEQGAPELLFYGSLATFEQVDEVVALIMPTILKDVSEWLFLDEYIGSIIANRRFKDQRLFRERVARQLYNQNSIFLIDIIRAGLAVLHKRCTPERLPGVDKASLFAD